MVSNRTLGDSLLSTSLLSAANSDNSITLTRRSKVVNLAKVKRLKPKFADAIIDLEEAIESENFDQTTVNKLLSAYEEAVQYYNAKNVDRKAMFYQRKLCSLLQKPNVMGVMSGKTPDVV